MSSSAVGAGMLGATVLRRARRTTNVPPAASMATAVRMLQPFASDSLSCFDLTVASMTDPSVAEALLAIDAPAEREQVERTRATNAPVVPRPAGDPRLPSAGGATSLNGVGATRVTDRASQPASRPASGVGSTPVTSRTSAARPEPTAPERRRSSWSDRRVAGLLAPTQASAANPAVVEPGIGGSRRADPSERLSTWTARVIAVAAATRIQRADARSAEPTPQGSVDRSPMTGAGTAAPVAEIALPAAGGEVRPDRRVALPPPRGVDAPTVPPIAPMPSGTTQLAGLARWWTDTHGPDEPGRHDDPSATARPPQTVAPPTPPTPPTTSPTPSGSFDPSAGLPTCATVADREWPDHDVRHLDELRIAFGGLLEDILISEARADGIEVRP